MSADVENCAIIGKCGDGERSDGGGAGVCGYVELGVWFDDDSG